MHLSPPPLMYRTGTGPQLVERVLTDSCDACRLWWAGLACSPALLRCAGRFVQGQYLRGLQDTRGLLWFYPEPITYSWTRWHLYRMMQCMLARLHAVSRHAPSRPEVLLHASQVRRRSLRWPQVASGSPKNATDVYALLKSRDGPHCRAFGRAAQKTEAAI